MQDDYTNRELDSQFTSIKDTLGRIEKQVTKTNGRVNRLERNMLIVSCVVGTILFLKYPDIIRIIKLFI
jgi:hypothetical protein